MLKITILKVESPSCLWGRTAWGLDGKAQTTEHYNKLTAQMNLFYQDVTQDQCRLKPTTLEKGQVYVVYWAVRKSWCRAVVESVITDSVACQARCLLVDHGEELLIPSNKIRVAMQNFLQLPFWVRRFHLAQIKPTTLRVSVHEEMAELIPSSQWDSSATLYLLNLLRVSTQVEAVLLESEPDSTSIKLYVTVDDIKICVNDDLVAKRFAYYNSKSGDAGTLDKNNRLPIMLSSSILTQTISTTSKLTAQTRPPAVMSKSPAADGASDWLTAPSPPQKQQCELVTSEGNSGSEVTEEQLPPIQSKKGSEGAAAESDSSEDRDPFLTAALTKTLSMFRYSKVLNPGSSCQQLVSSVGQNEEVTDCRPENTWTSLKDCREQDSTIQLTTGHKSEPETPGRQTSLRLSGEGEAEDLPERSSQVNYQTDRGTSCSAPHYGRSAESGPAEDTWRSEEDRTRLQFLEWLNPGLLTPDPNSADDMVYPSHARKSEVLVHSAFPVEPCDSLDDAPITDAFRRVLKKQQYSCLSPADRYSWPAVARGRHTLIVSHNAVQPLSYLPPLLTHILLQSYTSHTSSSGPIAVLLCPSWEKVQAVYDLLEETRVAQTLHPVTVLLGIGKDEAKAVRIPKNCLLLVTTSFALVRLLSCHGSLFLRLYHLLLDEADQLFTLAPDQMATILQHFQRVTSMEENASCPQQLVAVSKRWTSHMEGLLANYMPHPCVVITVPEEAALYGNIQQIILMTLESSKISALLGVLDFNPDVGQKTVIVANSAQEVEDVFQAVNNESVFCLKTHEGSTHQFDFVVQQWRTDMGPGTHIILVTTNESLQCLGIRDANCVVHYAFPSSPKMFGSRLFCMAENFRNLSERVQPQIDRRSHVANSVVLVSERNARHVVGLVRYLGRTGAVLPPDLLSFAKGTHVAREDQKTNRPLCSYLKSFGVCRDSSVCPDRHRFMSQLDQSELPASGVIEVVPLYIKTASVFYGRIVRKDNDCFDTLASEMTSYYSDKKPGATELLEGGLYMVQEDQVFHRVKILSVPDRGDLLFFSVFVRFIDVGKEQQVKSYQILQLPEQFQSLPGQAVEVVVCQVKPVDAETDWHPKVTRLISQKIRGLQHQARAVLSLGNTVFLDAMVRLTKVPGTGIVINEYSVQSEILRSGMGVRNPEHLDLLKALCHEEGHTAQLGDGFPFLEVGIKAEEEVQAFTTSAHPPHLEPCEPLSPVCSTIQSLVQAAPASELLTVPGSDQKSQFESHSDSGQSCPADMESAEHMERNREVFLTTGPAVQATPCENGLSEDPDQSHRQQVISTSGTDCSDSAVSFHPQVRWYETSDRVTVTVKLMNPESQRCHFYPDRVVYSGRVNGRSYRADLELHQNITMDSCCWEMKSNEPVLKLVKQEQGYWDKLLRNRNIFVSYDMDHVDEDEDTAQNGLWFLENTGEGHGYVSSESGSDSD